MMVVHRGSIARKTVQLLHARLQLEMQRKVRICEGIDTCIVVREEGKLYAWERGARFSYSI